MPRPSELRPKRKPALEPRIYTSSPLAASATGQAKVLVPPPSPRPPLSPMNSSSSVNPAKPRSEGKSSTEEQEREEKPVSKQEQLKKALAAESSSSSSLPAAASAGSLAASTSASSALTVPPENIDERRLSGVGTYGVGLGLLSTETLSDSEDEEGESDDEHLLSPRVRSPVAAPVSAPVSSKMENSPVAEKPAVATSAPVPVGLGITVPNVSRAPSPTTAKHAALFAAATQGPSSPGSLAPSSPDPTGREAILSPPPPAYSQTAPPQQQVRDEKRPFQPPQPVQQGQGQGPQYASPVPRPIPRPLDLSGATGFPGPGGPGPQQRGPPMIQIPGPLPGQGHPQPILRQAGPYPSPQAPYLTPPPPARQSPFSSPQSNGSIHDPLLPPRTPGTPSSLSPHPLPPSSPITPLFAAPRSQRGSVRFSMAVLSPLQQGVGGALGIMRSEKEDALPVRKREKPPSAVSRPQSLAGWGRSGTTDDGDAFWRRFSMVAKAENRKPAQERHSNWLARRLASRQVTSRILVCCVILGICALGGGIACAWYFTHRGNGGPTYPVAIGGSAGEVGATTTAAGHVSTWVPPIRRRVRALGRMDGNRERGAEELEALEERGILEEREREREKKRLEIPRATGLPVGARAAHRNVAKRWAVVREWENRGLRLEDLD